MNGSNFLVIVNLQRTFAAHGRVKCHSSTRIQTGVKDGPDFTLAAGAPGIEQEYTIEKFLSAHNQTRSALSAALVNFRSNAPP